MLWIFCHYCSSSSPSNASSSGHPDHSRSHQLCQFSVRISQKNPKTERKPKTWIVCHGYVQQVCSSSWGVFISASVKMALSSAAPALLQCKEPWLPGVSPSSHAQLGAQPCCGPGVRGCGCAAIGGCHFILSLSRREQRIRCWEPACWACWGVFSQRFWLTGREYFSHAVFSACLPVIWS